MGGMGMGSSMMVRGLGLDRGHRHGRCGIALSHHFMMSLALRQMRVVAWATNDWVVLGYRYRSS
jgi:hypothetical protein